MAVDITTVAARAKKIATEVLAVNASKNDEEGRFSGEAVAASGEAGLLGLLVPTAYGGAGLGPRAACEVIAAFAEVDPSAAMVFLMHACGTSCLAASTSRGAAAALREIASGKHLSTLAFSESGSRSHFWAPVSKSQRTPGGARLNAKKSWVTSAGHAQSYIVSTLSADAKGGTDSTLYMVRGGSPGLFVSGGWSALGMRANASNPMMLEACDVHDDDRVSDEGAGFKVMLEVVLPLFNAGQAALGVGICRGVVAGAIQHLKTARFEHLGVTLGEALPTLRARLAQMQIDTDGLAARLSDTLGHLEQPGELTMLRVLEVKAAAGDTAIKVTSEAMQVCGGAAFSKHLGIERLFRDAHACAVMAPTGDVLREFIGKAILGIPLFE